MRITHRPTRRNDERGHMFVTIKARVYTDSSGVHTELPALLTPAGVLEPLLDYCLYRSHDRSLSWMSKLTRSVRMFLEYLHFNPAENDSYRLFQNFAQRLYTGTFDRDSDTTLGWVEREHPQLATWRALAVEWLRGETSGVYSRLKAIVAFFERYLVQQNLPLDPVVFMARTTILPDFYRTACPDSPAGIKCNNSVHAFLHSLAAWPRLRRASATIALRSEHFCKSRTWILSRRRR